MGHRRQFTNALVTLLASTLLLGAGCAMEEQEELDDLYGMNGAVNATPPPGKYDSEYRRGLWVNTNTTRTQVWTARNKWEDTDTAAAREAGIAWGESSGLNWDQKYQRWVDSMERTASTAGYYDTYTLTTPWGKSLPSPSLECAEMGMFLRITFAAWYELPFFLEAVDQHGARIYFGHNGIRTQHGRYSNTPEYGVRYRDYSSMSPSEYQASWPKDNTLRARKLYGSSDLQPALGEDVHFGTYVDEIHLNKRVGYFTMLTLNYLGSMNLADTANTYNIVPEAVSAGDVLVKRWQKRGIGHTLVVKEVVEIGEGNKDVTLVSGSMPRRQGKWESGVASKNYFTSNYTGGVGENSDGDEYAKLGGGIKRFRVTKNINGYWTNTWMNSDEAHWINSTDYARIAARPARFDQMLGQVSPDQLRDELLAQIEDSRMHLRNYPASCAARERREVAWNALYDILEREFNITRAQADAQHRVLEDYVFAELEYNQSKTCCWNSTTSAMHQIILDYANKEQEEAEAAGTCVAPTVFMNRGGYGLWSDYAASTGRGAQWVPWSEDESCSQRNVASDTEREHEWTEFCSLPAGGGGGDEPDSCTDAFEPNDSSEDAADLNGSHDGLQICDHDVDWFAVPSGGSVRISFSHSTGDLDMRSYDASGAELDVSQGTVDEEVLSVPAGARIKVYGYNGATGPYSISVN
jgi:hypothetical protein